MSLSTRMDFNAASFSRAYPNARMTEFNHVNFAFGEIDPSLARKLIVILDSQARRISPSISFQDNCLEKSLTTGACSTLAFRVAREAIEGLKIIESKPSHHDIKESLFAWRLQKFISGLENQGMSSDTSSLSFKRIIRTEQAALNCIAVNQKREPSDQAVPEKVGAMASFYGLKVTHSSPAQRIKGNPLLEECVVEQIANLKIGVYLLRIIQEEKNHKLEMRGHSAVYIKTSGSNYYFDVMVGFYHLFSEALKTQLVYQILLGVNGRLGVDLFSFHRLELAKNMSAPPLSSKL